MSIVLVAEIAFALTPSFTVHVTVRLESAPSLVGSALDELKITDLSTA